MRHNLFYENILVVLHFRRCAYFFYSPSIELNPKNDRQIYLSHRQSANRVEYLLVTFEI